VPPRSTPFPYTTLFRSIRERGARVSPLTAHEEEPGEEVPDPAGPAAFVVNPVKVADGAALRRRTAEIAADFGLPEPLWFETTVRSEEHTSELQSRFDLV